MKFHYLKINPEHLEQVILGNKTAEVRFNDRDFHVGDLLFLRGYLDGKYMNARAVVQITHILDNNEYMRPGFVVLSVKPFVYFN